MRSDSVKNMSAYADQNHAPSLAVARLEFTGKNAAKIKVICTLFTGQTSKEGIFMRYMIRVS